MISKKLTVKKDCKKTVGSVTLYRLEFVSLPITDKLQPNLDCKNRLKKYHV